MRFYNYKLKFVAYNTLTYLVITLASLFLILQVLWYLSINNIKEELLQVGTDVNLYFQEKTADINKDEDKLTYYIKNSGDIYNAVASYSNCQLQLFNLDGQLIASDTNNDEAVNMTKEIAESKDTLKPVISIRTDDGLRQVWLLSPIITNNDQIIGYSGMIKSLAQADQLQQLVLEIIGAIFLIGFFIIIIVSYSLGNSFIKPIKTLTKISSEINNGQYDKVIQYKKQDEIGVLTNVYNQMIQNINNVIIQLKGERRRLANILASLDDGVIAVDDEGNILLTNKYVKTYFDVVDPKTIYDFEFQTSLINLFNNLKTGKKNIIEEVEVKGRVLLITGSPITSDVIEENYLIIIRNITAVRNQEKEQRKFISSISHELRTPLTTIIGYTDMLSRRKVDNHELLEKSLNTINREGHRLVRLVDDLVNANSVENMVSTIHLEEINIDKLLEDVVDQMRVKSWSKEIEIAYKAEDNLPSIPGDYDRIRQIFINIIHNAIKFSHHGGKIDVVLTKEDDQFLNISIRDYGIGIDPAKKDLIFSAFYRVDEDRARNEGEGGAGLGLYLVKQVVDKHNGRIKIESEIDEGTNITILLPIQNEIVDEKEVI